jgi:hypothetical protein
MDESKHKSSHFPQKRFQIKLFFLKKIFPGPSKGPFTHPTRTA